MHTQGRQNLLFLLLLVYTPYSYLFPQLWRAIPHSVLPPAALPPKLNYLYLKNKISYPYYFYKKEAMLIS